MSLSRNINSCNLFIVLYTAYMFLRAHKASSLTGYMLLLITVISFGYFIYIQFKMRQPRMLKWLSILFGMFAVYGLIYILFGETVYSYIGPIPKTDYIKKIASSLLPVYPFYYFASKGIFRLKYLNFWLPIFIFVAIFSYINHYDNMLTLAHERGVIATEFTNNTGYLFVSLLPLIFLRKGNPIITYIYLSICAIFIVMGVKRGAIITGGLSIAYYIYCMFRNSKGSKKVEFIFLSVVAIGIAGYYITNYIESSSYFSQRVSHTLDGDSSGRDDLYKQMIDIFINSDVLAMLFGHGADSTLYFASFFAHNDWLELLTNQGILGLFIYLMYFVSIYKTWQIYHTNGTIGLCLSGLSIVLFLKTIFSMSYTEYTLFVCMAYGYCMGYINILKSNKNNAGRS